MTKQIIEPSIQQKYIQEVINDFRTCCISRETSLLGRKEVLTGKAKFGIFGDGKEVPQVAMARVFREGDFRSGYYRDQTFAMASGLCSVKDFFAQLYADSDNDPYSGGRQMNAHFATPTIDKDGNWLEIKSLKNIASDHSSTAGQMARAVGLALASKKYRDIETLRDTPFSDNGNEVCFCTIGDASTSEGVFWESMNAVGVMQVPLAVSVWDDGYGISVPIEYQTTKGSISKLMAGFKYDRTGQGVDIHTAHAWDYPALCKMYAKGIKKVREKHIPSLFHIQDCTQPQGHSTSGSHERYKSKERLAWEIENDCIEVMARWMIKNKIATQAQIDEIRKEAKTYVREEQRRAWATLIDPIKKGVDEISNLYKNLVAAGMNDPEFIATQVQLEKHTEPLQYEVIKNVKRALRQLNNINHPDKNALEIWLRKTINKGREYYNTQLYSATSGSALNVPEIPATYSDSSPRKNGYEILNTCFSEAFKKYPNVLAFGEDVGHIGDVNQGFAGLQKEYGESRIFDTGIREWTIMGQAIGMAMRGLRPIAEIQYLDYLLYGLTPLADDLATLRYRSDGIQKAPAIIRTRGHRLEGIWHSGSPIGMIINSLRGMYVCVPRNMTQAAGMYNTLLAQSDDPAIVIECLNGYRLKETLPDNIAEFTVPLGVAEVLQEGTDITLVTYGSCVRVAQEAITQLGALGISIELIDVQTLLPFDIHHKIAQSLQKTNRFVILDEDVPGGASAYILQQVLEQQDAYHLLDSKPVTITAAPHRSAYGSDGDYFSKPQVDDVFEKIYAMMNEVAPDRFPKFYFM